jgi:hypothetical protein
MWWGRRRCIWRETGPKSHGHGGMGRANLRHMALNVSSLLRWHLGDGLRGVRVTEDAFNRATETDVERLFGFAMTDPAG